MNAVVTFDDIITFGKYQVINTILLCIPASFVNAWPFFNFVFMFYSPPKSCAQWNVNESILQLYNIHNFTGDQCELIGRTVSQTNGTSNVALQCEKWSYDKTYFQSTVMTRWDRVCDDEFWAKNMIGVYSLVGILGAIPMSFIQDYLGRKIAFLVSLTFVLLGGGFSLLAPTFTWFAVIRSLMATQTLTTYTVPFVWNQEFVSANKRTWTNFVMTLWYSTAAVTLGLVAYACRTWIELGLITTIPFVALYSYIFLVDESPRWLLSMGKLEEAEKVMHKIYRTNGKSVEPEILRNQLKTIMDSVKQMHAADTTTRKKSSLKDLFMSKNVRWKTLLITFSWIANILIYSSLAFNAPNLGNLYAAYIIQAAVEAPACVLNLVLTNRAGRIVPIFVAMLISASFCFLCIPAYIKNWDEWFPIIFAALAKFGVCVSYNILYQAAGELYPTTVRATGVNFSCTIGTAFVVAMPLILQTAATEKWLPMVILGAIAFTAAFASILLPEPMDLPMPQTVEEAEASGPVGWKAVKMHFKRMSTCKKMVD